MGLLDDATRCLLAFAGASGPLLVPMAHWFDGEALWLTSASDSMTVRRLAADPDCSVCLTANDRAVIAPGRARRFGLNDPARLALHAGPISGALAALAFRNAATLLGYARGNVLVPARWRPQNRVVIRITLDDARLVDVPTPGAGVAPQLPSVVPSDIRRAHAGRRQVVVAHGSGRPDISLATWGAGFALTGADGDRLEIAGRVAVGVDADDEGSPLGARGLVLHGEVVAGRLRPARVTWWRGFDLETADVPADTAPSIVLPD